MRLSSLTRSCIPASSVPCQVRCRPNATLAHTCYSLKPSAVETNGSYYSEDEYQLQRQSQERAEWAASVRAVTGRRKHEFWEPQLSPPALLANVVVVLVSPRRPASVGTVSRSASCFEVSSLRLVQPRCNYVTRHSKSSSKGAQYLLMRADVHQTVAEATADCDLSVAFTRWVSSGRNVASYDLPALMAHPTVQTLIHEPVPTVSGQSSLESAPEDATPAAASAQSESVGADGLEQAAPGPHGQGDGGRRIRLALVFGREELGLADDEVEACDLACCIPIGRLQESLSLSHAVSIALSGIYAQRVAYVASQGAGIGSEYIATSTQGLAEGFDASVGVER